MWRWNNRLVTSVGQRKKSESPTGFEPMTSQTPGGCSIHWATENSWRARPYTRFLLSLLMMSTHPRPTRELPRMAGSERGREESEKRERESINHSPPPFFPSSQSPTLFDACYIGYNGVILLSMFASILFVIAVSFVSSALSLLYVLVLSLSFFSGPRIVACSGVIQASWRSL